MKKLPYLFSQLVLLLALVFTANGVVSAKVVSGPSALSSGLHQSQAPVESLLRLGSAVFSYDDAVGSLLVPKGVGNKADDVIHVTKDGVALPPGAKHKIPDNYVQNPHRSGNYGEIVDGKYKERLRIDPATPPGQKGPNYSHYHKNGKGKHYSPRDGDSDPGF